jgi:hypothetical protein
LLLARLGLRAVELAAPRGLHGLRSHSGLGKFGCSSQGERQSGLGATTTGVFRRDPALVWDA